MPFNGTSYIAQGQAGPPYVSGRHYLAPGYTMDGLTVFNTTSTRLYYHPFFIRRSSAFAAGVTINGGSGDNGETLRLGVYSNNNGSPGTLEIDFGEITLTGAVAVRTASNAVTLGFGLHWIAQHHNTACSMYAMSDLAESQQSEHGILGSPTAATMAAWAGFYVDTAYGALAASAVAPTATTDQVPVFWLKA